MKGMNRKSGYGVVFWMVSCFRPFLKVPPALCVAGPDLGVSEVKGGLLAEALLPPPPTPPPPPA